jgi:hypothetical protein
MATKPVRRQCATMAVYHQLLEMHPEFRRNLTEIEQAASHRMMLGPRVVTTPTIIPVVVHVLFNTPEENISMEQIESQIAVLNNDYRAQNPDKVKVPPVWNGLIIDPFIQFALAKKDPAGNPTDGINRKQTDRTSFPADDSMKSNSTGGSDAWPTDKYLNIWVCALGAGLLGYAQFPGGPPATDGVVILNTAFGTTGTANPPFHLGRTSTHEIGHWLNLRHIWGDDLPPNACVGSDFVDDTPNQEGPNFGKPVFPHITCDNGPNGDMFMNYMDYVDDDCMFMFTPQQVARMQATLEGPRQTLGKDPTLIGAT